MEYLEIGTPHASDLKLFVGFYVSPVVAGVVFVFAGERAGHAGPDGAAPRGAGGTPPDLQAVARIRGGRLAGVAAGLHCCSDGERGCSANPQRCVYVCFGCYAAASGSGINRKAIFNIIINNLTEQLVPP